MKKSLIALAVLAASGAAMAQSTVTLYGVADVSVAKTTGAKLAASANGLANNGNSRFGLRGSEDLGGGLKANFNFEQNVSLADGSTCNLTTCAAGQAGLNTNAFQRAAWFELAGGFGSLRAGRSLSPSFYGIASWELTGAANYSAVASMFGFGAGLRNNVMVAYTTPNLGGLTASIGHVLEGNGAANAHAGLNKWDMTVIYAAGPVTAALTYGKVENGVKNVTLGGAMNFGGVKVAASFQDPAGAVKGFTLGASAPMGPVTLTADLARDTGSAVKSTDYIIEAKYALSKRTFAYGIIHRDGSAKVNTTCVGVRHDF